MLPREVVATDHNLEAVADKASGQLAGHRWHWTLDESNPDRVGIREYARAVDRTHAAIVFAANGYAAWIAAGGYGSVTTFLARERMSGETAAAAEAVAAARGLTVGSAARLHRPEVRQVRESARQRAEEHGTTVEDELPLVAEHYASTDRAERRLHAERAKRRPLRFAEVDGHLANAERELRRAVTAGRSVDWDDDSAGLLSERAERVAGLATLIATGLAGGGDWDTAELEAQS
jgi:hypothetical protein